MKIRYMRFGRKLVCLGLMAVMILLSSISANAREAGTEEFVVDRGEYIEEYANLARNAVIRTCSSSLAISGSTATCAGTGSAYASMASSVKLNMYLQKKNGSSWESVTSWSTTASSSTAIISKTYTIGSGTYRVKIVCTAGGETVTVYSLTKTK